jgi:hypothetical protein
LLVRLVAFSEEGEGHRLIVYRRPAEPCVLAWVSLDYA